MKNMAKNPQSVEGQRVPPHNLEAEAAVLGAALLNNTAFNVAATRISASDFYAWKHRYIWESMLRLSKAGEPIDSVTVGNDLIKSGNLEKCGGVMALEGLTEAVATVANVAHYATIIARKAALRRVIYAAQSIVSEAFENGGEDETVEEFLAQSRADFTVASLSLASTGSVCQSASQGMHDLFNALEAGKPIVETLPIGFGGVRIPRGTPTVVGGRPSNGKSVVAMTAARNLAAQGRRGIYFSLEETARVQWARLVCQMSGVAAKRIIECDVRGGEFKVLADAASEAARLNLYLCDRTGIDSMFIRQEAAAHKERNGLDFVVVDYIQLIREKVRSGQARHERFAEAMQGLVDLARELDIAVIVVSQIRRSEFKPEKEPSPPSIEQLKESGEIEQAAKLILLLHYPYFYTKSIEGAEQKPNALRMDIAKDSIGEGGVRMLYANMPRLWVGDNEAVYEPGHPGTNWQEPREGY
jgi:replicative DNA helicase